METQNPSPKSEYPVFEKRKLDHIKLKTLVVMIENTMVMTRDLTQQQKSEDIDLDTQKKRCQKALVLKPNI